MIRWKIRLGWQEIYLIIVFALALLARILCMNLVKTEQLFDFATYQLLAENIANGLGHTMDGVPVAWQGCGYPYLLGFFYRIVGSTDEVYAKGLNVFLSMATLCVCWPIYKRMFGKVIHALAALTLTAFLPQYIAYVNVIGTEIFFTFLLSMILCVQIYFGHRRMFYPVLGLLIGIAALTKPFMLVYPVICGVWMWTTEKNGKETFIFVGMAFVMAAVVVSPWAYRNGRLFNRLVPVSYNSGYVLYINNNDMNKNGAWLDLAVAASADEVSAAAVADSLENGGRSIKKAHELEPLLKKKAQEWILQNPLEFAKLGFLRIEQTFFAGANDVPQWAANVTGYGENATAVEMATYERNHNAATGFMDVVTYIINAAGFIFLFASFVRYTGAVFTKKRRVDLLTGAVFINIAYFTVIAFAFEGQARYAFPVFIFMIPAFVKIFAGIRESANPERVNSESV